MLVTLKGGKNPVLAHLFLNHMLDPAVAKENFSAIGYQPPQNSLTADSLVAEAFIPENLRSAIVKPEYFDSRLPPARTGRGQRRRVAQRLERVQRRRVLGPVLQRSREPNARLWAALAAPGIGWLLLFFLAPLYVVLAIVFGRVDPLFRTAVPVWNPLQWNPSQFTYVLSRIGPDGVYFPALLRTVVYVGAASVLCLAHRLPGRLLRVPTGRPAQGPADRAADRTVLDQLHDANVGLGQPASERRPGEPAAEPRRPVRRRPSTGSPASPSW